MLRAALALLCFASLVASVAPSSSRDLTVQPGAGAVLTQPNTQQPTEISKLDLLAGKITQLKADLDKAKGDLAAMKGDLAAAKKDAADAKKDAAAANFKATLAVNWVNQNGPNILKLVAAYPTHKHEYGFTSVGWDNHVCKNGEGGPGTVSCSYVKSTKQLPADTGPPK
jgi:outer membrane murein-binding lipoprotein Lpp